MIFDSPLSIESAIDVMAKRRSRTPAAREDEEGTERGDSPQQEQMNKCRLFADDDGDNDEGGTKSPFEAPDRDVADKGCWTHHSVSLYDVSSATGGGGQSLQLNTPTDKSEDAETNDRALRSRFASTSRSSTGRCRLATYNVWMERVDRDRVEQIVDVLRHADADVLALQ